MKHPIKSNGLIFASVLTLASFSTEASAALIASWDFGTGTSADLTSGNGLYTFTRSVAGNGPAYSAGSLSLDQYTGLFASGVNSASLPALTANATLYVRMRFDTPVASQAGFFFGLIDATAAADWGQMSLTAWSPNGVNMGVYGWSTGEGATTPVAVPAVGEFFTLALVVTQGLDQNGFADPGLTQIRMNYNGFETSIGLTGSGLQAFDSLALGQLKASGGIAGVTFDLVQLYDESLSPSQIAAVSAIPEPSSAALLIGGVALGGVLIGRRRRTRV